MTNDYKNLPPAVKGHPGVSDPGARAATVEGLKEFLRKLPDEERRKASIELGVQIPKIDDSTGKEVRVFGYRCKSCNDIGLEFLGDSWEVWADKGDGNQEAQTFPYPPTHVPFAELRWVQDGPARTPGGKVRQSKSRSDPICQHCGNALAKGPGGGIHPRRVVKLEEWRTLVAEQRRREEHPLFRYDRDAKPAPWAAAGKGRAVPQ